MSDGLESSLEKFAQQYPLVSFEVKEFLLRSGEAPHFFFFLKEGCVKMFATSPQGANLTLHIFYPGTCLSLLSLVEPAEHTFDFQSLTEGSAYKVPFDDVKHFIQQHPEVSYSLLQKVLQGTQGLLFRLQQSSFVTAYYQVASILLYFAKHSELKEGSSTPLSLRVTHQDIADWLGLSRENVSMQMKQLERDGYIERHGKMITVKDSDKLSTLVKEQTTSII